MNNRFYDPGRVSVLVRIKFVLALGVLFCLIGITTIILSVVELFEGRAKEYHYNEAQGGLQIENPLWPSSGKGFWVGLILLATGLVGILASREWTPQAIIGFTILTSFSTILSFYMVITCIIPVYYDTHDSSATRPTWQRAELVINALLIAAGSLVVLLGSIASIVGCCFVGWCTNQRDDPRYSDEPGRILLVPPNPIRYPRATGPRFPYSPRVRSPLRL